MFTRDSFSALIHSNIEKHGYHITLVTSDLGPRFAYSIGLKGSFGFELIFAGGIIFFKDDLTLIFDRFVEALKTNAIKIDEHITIEDLGNFSLSIADPSWTSHMTLGVFDHYKRKEITVYQILPDKNHHTLDIPDMTKVFEHSSQPIWKWLVVDWDHPVPRKSTVVTNIGALLGEQITEVTRWEDDEWEMFAGAGPDVEKEDIRVVSLGIILGIDDTLLPAISLANGEGLWREEGEQTWNDWK